MIYAWSIVGQPTPYLNVKSYSLNSKLNKQTVFTIAGFAQIIEGSGKAHILLPIGTHLFIQNALYSSSS